jgi:hypothetical protein
LPGDELNSFLKQEENNPVGFIALLAGACFMYVIIGGLIIIELKIFEKRKSYFSSVQCFFQANVMRLAFFSFHFRQIIPLFYLVVLPSFWFP